MTTFPRNLACFTLLCLMLAAGCTSMNSTLTRREDHGGIRYSFPRSALNSRVEKSRDGGLMYDSPELTVDARNGQLLVNGVDCGPLREKDHVEVTDLNTVLVNGQRRGDSSTGATQNRQRVQHTVRKMEG